MSGSRSWRGLGGADRRNHCGRRRRVGAPARGARGARRPRLAAWPVPTRRTSVPTSSTRTAQFWSWLAERELLPHYSGPPLAGIRFRWQGEIRRTPPLGTIPAVLRLRGREAPVDQDFRSWVASHSDERTAAMLSAAAGVYTFHHDPGELSAAFVWKHSVRVLLSPPPTARYLHGGWSSLIESLEARARRLGVEIETGHAVEALPDSPLIVATELGRAGELLGDDSLSWPGGQHGLHRPRPRAPPRRPLHRLRPRRVRLGRALQRRRPLAGPGRRGAGAGADAGAARRGRRADGAAPGAPARGRLPRTGASASAGAAAR